MGLLILVSFFTLLWTGWAESAGHKATPLARRGVLDLIRWDFQTDGNIDLNGEWEFYRQQLLSPDEISAVNAGLRPDFYIIPGLWNGREFNGQKQPGDGYATFRLRVKLRPAQPVLAIRILDESSAYQLWVNGRKIAANGVVGTSRATTHPQYLLQISRVPAESDILDIVMQVANFSHAKGGIWSPVTLGAEQALVRTQELKWGLDLFLFGSLLIMGAYHLCLFLLRRKDPSVVYFGVFSLLVAFRTVITENRFLTYLLPNFPWELVFKGELLTVHVSFLMLLLFIHSLYPDECARWLMRLLQGICLACAMVTLATSAKISSLLVVPFHPVIMIILGYIVFVLIKAIRQQRSGAASILLGLLVFFLAVVNDILHNHSVIATPYIAPFGFLFLVGSQSFALAQRFSQSCANEERLSAEREEHILALSRLDRLKDEFLATTSHELRTPLNGIIGLAESLCAGALGTLNQAALTHLEMIASSGRRLNNLVNDLLDLSRLKNRDITLRRQAVDLRALVASVLTVSQPLVHSRQLALLNAIPSDLPLVDGDEDRLQQVLFNLVGNAIKFTDQGEIAISAVAGQSEIEVAVRDTGIGIPVAQLESIFAAFVQVDGSGDRSHGGVGLGLGISRHLVELHGGRLWAESSPGSGATFRFTVPVAAFSAAPPAAKTMNYFQPPSPVLLAPIATGQEPVPSLDRDAPCVLAVDDDPVNLQVVLSHLRVEGMAVTTAAGGREALALLEGEEVFDLVLLDVMMPGMTGYEVCRTLRHRYNAAELPVIMLTACNRVADLSEGLSSGANDYLGKPFAREELLARVRAQLGVRKAYKLSRENSRLQGELESRCRTELELRLGQRRLAGMLHSLPDRIVAINENREIAFCNQAFETCFGYSAADLLGQSVPKLFPAEAGATVERWLTMIGAGGDSLPPIGARLELLSAAGPSWSGTVMPAALELEEERLLILVIGDTPGAAPSLRWIDGLSRNRRQLQQLEETLNGLTPLILEQCPGFINELHAVDRSLECLDQELRQGAPKQEQRRLIVETMKLALDLWCEATRTGKAELARRSGLWSVYVNQDGWERTQTLDRYLTIDTLPASPRLKTVLQTVDFVLESCPDPTPLHQRLVAARAHLR
ncbi:MAG TPA: response regulator [Deltaproteobacteria bacterium]|nr:response regulator [Deltaproteobacteria bacterium]